MFEDYKRTARLIMNDVSRLYSTETPSLTFRAMKLNGYFDFRNNEVVLGYIHDYVESVLYLAHESWHSVQWQIYPDLVKLHEEFLSSVDTTYRLLDWITPFEIDARLFARELHDCKYIDTCDAVQDYRAILNLDKNHVLEICNRPLVYDSFLYPETACSILGKIRSWCLSPS